MLTFFFILAVGGVLVLAVHIVVELNAMEKNVADLIENLRKRYEDSRSTATNQSEDS